MVDDDLAGKTSADAPLREGLLERILDRADRQPAAVIETGAETHHQKLILADSVIIPGIIKCGIACLIVFFFLFRRDLFRHRFGASFQDTLRINGCCSCSGCQGRTHQGCKKF